MTESDAIAIVGGGHAAAQLYAGLVEAGLGSRVHLVCEEAELPYQRPPLSKAYLKNPGELLQEHRGPAWFSDHAIALHRADAVTTIDRTAKRVTLRSGAVLPYAQLVLATGTRARQLHGIPPGLSNVAVVRTAWDAERMRSLLTGCPMPQPARHSHMLHRRRPSCSH